MNTRTLFRRISATSAALLLACIAAAQSQTFTVDDLKKMVSELELYCPRNPAYEYPILCEVEQNDEPNAYATIRDQGEGKKPRAVMVVLTGIMPLLKGDRRLLRATIAHEMSHLSNGHALDEQRAAADDFFVLYTRQMEYEADEMGAAMLQRAGYTKQDMIDLLLLFDNLNRESSHHLIGLMADHADPKARVAAIADNPTVWRACVDYDAGLGMIEARKFNRAIDAFEAAAKKEPKLTEALTMAAQAALMDYYDNLPGNYRESFFRPDFGPVIKTPALLSKAAAEPGEEDFARYDRVVTALSNAEKARPADPRVAELRALTLILDPRKKTDNIAAGVKQMQSLAAKAMTDADKLRFANNIALGLQRQGNLKQAVAGLWTAVNAIKSKDNFNASAAENLTAWQLPKVEKGQAAAFANYVATWLNTSYPDSDRYKAVLKAYNTFCTTNKVKGPEIETPDISVSRIISMVIDGKEFTLLDPISKVVEKLGKAEKFTYYNERYKSFGEYRWSGGDFLIFADRNQAYRITSYRSGTKVQIKPKDLAVQSWITIEVGKTIKGVLPIDVADLPDINLVRTTEVEKWKYLPGLGLALSVDANDIVTAVSVIPFGDYDQ